MIELPKVDLPKAVEQQLTTYQRNLDNILDYSERVATARVHFRNRNRTDNATFQEVRNSLTLMCSGARRCCYCEDSCADEVEHIRPKHLYPEETFVWENYLYSCGGCNNRKLDKYAVFIGRTGKLTEIKHSRGKKLAPPPSGDHVLIDPRKEDPLQYMELDLIDTFYFLPTPSKNSRDFQRADYTIKILELNSREYLPKARQEAYYSYRAQLKEYIHDRDLGATAHELQNRIVALQRMAHPTVWAEVKRQHAFLPQLSTLFREAPEALNW